MAETQAALGGTDGASSPLPQAGFAVQLLDTTNLGTDPNTTSAIVSVSQFRRITLWITASADAASVYPHLIPLVSAASGGTAPAIGDDSWFGLPERDASATATLLTGSFPASFDATIAPEWAVVTTRPIVIRLEASDANTDEIRMALTLDVTTARWFCLLSEEVGGNVALKVWWNGSL